jgi:prolyl oligopeptidase
MGDSMRRWRLAAAMAIVLTQSLLAGAVHAAADAPADPYLWLEDVTGPKALQWVHEQDARASSALEASPDFEPMRKRFLSIMNSDLRIPHLTKYGKYYYNFWRDPQHVRGIWRRTDLTEYKKPQPNWETVIDLDQLAAAEKENWVWEGETVLEPEYDRCLISLSRGGADASVLREFDLTSKTFVAGGFNVPEAKQTSAWHNRDSIYIGTDFGPGSLTTSGYPRIIKEWKRGTPLSQATTVFQAKETDVGLDVSVEHDHGHVYEFIDRSVTFFTHDILVHRGDQWIVIDKPADAEAFTYSNYLLLRLITDWTVAGKAYRAGSLLAADFDQYLQGDRHFAVLFDPTPQKTVQSITATKNYLIITELNNVRTQSFLLRVIDGQWTWTPMNLPQFTTAEIQGVDENESDDYFLTLEDFLTPPTLYLGVAGQEVREKLKSQPAFFNADGLEITQHQAVSTDGTKVPYFQVGRGDIKLDGTNKTILYGYGGFEISLLPSYHADVGAAWLERGGVYVVANIRGGGEFGPSWHNAARKENRQRAYDDFIAVAEDLISRGVTSPKHLGIQGRSNGGLLMGVMLTERPDLFAAVDCGSPLLDMRRYNQLLAGASWMDEYGDPDNPTNWAYISKYSPYQNVVKGRQYPPVLFTTSTRDDRVHPGHARKMAALLEAYGNNVLYYENTEGGHGAAANNEQAAYMNALAYTFFWKNL